MAPPTGDEDTLLYWIHADGRILDVSRAACDALAFTRDELRRMAVWDIDPAVDPVTWAERWAVVERAGALRFQAALRTRDGRPFDVDMFVQYLTFGDQAFLCAVVSPRSGALRTSGVLGDAEPDVSLPTGASGYALFELDLTTGEFVSNSAHMALLGRGFSDRVIAAEAAYSWLHPDDRDRVAAAFEACRRGVQAEVNVEMRVQHGAGHWIWLRSLARVMDWDEGGRPIRMLGMQVDITDRKRAEEALRLTQLSVDRASVSVFWFNPSGRVAFVNERACETLGYSREELIGAPVSLFDPEASDDDVRGVWDRAAETDQTVFERTHRRKDGSTFPVEVTVTRAAVGEAVYYFAFVRDISGRKITADAVRASKAFVDSIITQSPLPMLILNGNGAVVRSNPAALSLFRVHAGQVSLLDHNVFTDSRFQDAAPVAEVQRVLSDGESVRFTCRFDSGGADAGTAVQLDTTVFPIRNVVGEITHVGITCLDVTDLKAAERKLRRHLESEQLLADISALMIKPGWDDLEARMDWTLERVGQLAQADRAVLFAVSPDGRLASNTHEWCAPGVSSKKEASQNIAVADYAPFYARMATGAPVVIQAGTPDVGLRFRPTDGDPATHSLICVPVTGGERLLGVLALDAQEGHRVWSEVDVRFLRLVAEIIAHALQHLAAYRDLRAHSQALEHVDRISRVLNRSERDAAFLKKLAAEVQDIFQADRAYFMHPCDPSATTVCVTAEVPRAGLAPLGEEGREFAIDDELSRVFQAALTCGGPAVTGYDPTTRAFRETGVRSRMVTALRPQSSVPWLIGLHQVSHERAWTEAEQRLFQSISERIEEALSGFLLLQRLRASESRYRAVFDNALDAIIMHDAEGRILAVNAAMTTMYGLEAGEAEGRSALDLCDAGFSLDEARSIWARVMAGETIRFEWMGRRPKDGAVFPAEVMLRCMTFGNRSIVLANVRDITERKRAETTLRQSEERFAKAFQSNPAAMLISTIDEGRILDANDRWLTLFRTSHAALVGRTTVEVGLWRHAADRDALLESIRETGTLSEVPVVFYAADGTPIDVLWSAEVIGLKDEQVLLTLVIDLTEQMRAERARRESEVRLLAAVESIPFDFFILDADGDYVLQNSASKAEWGDVSERNPSDVTVHSQYTDRWGAKRDAVLSGQIIDEELRFVTKIGDRYFRNVLAPVRDGDDVRGMVELNMDVTERKRSERELQTYRAHLEDLVSARTRALQQAMTKLLQAEKLAALGNLVAGLAHEMNTPLGNARLVASTLDEQFKAMETALAGGALRRADLADFLRHGQEAVDLLERNTVRAADLIGQVKEVATDQTSMRRRVFRVLSITEDVVSTMRPTLKRTEHRVDLDIPPGLEMDSYPGPLEQILTNLIGNSVTHGFADMEAGCIRVTAGAEGSDALRIVYSDTGAGIPAEILQRVFDPFFTTRLGQGGSGLGLYIVYNLVTAVLGGTIEVDSPSADGDGGTVFTMVLPRSAPERARPDVYLDADATIGADTHGA
ncbi:PAS domain S-box protein [Roseospira marina]|uniref:histidine kinase n=1 Tax=Roseospira marina TaxID=140057 RepID=A0A5M6IDI1_9PROT|nr:PAS domain S-box protein [Roseospira marina]KAA5606017.1 PAS domain S-box protein [Roseospira marina]MBB4313125.1 PAS domain S-box-containing protein [Roseospira marina]MBB5086134.1 PAS domain S-box-containing protein [Roseospira marina]